MIDSVAGFISAAPAPWTTRAADQHLAGVGEPAQERRDREDDDADDEDEPAAVRVRDLAADEHERGEGEGVPGHDPLELGEVGVEVAFWIDGSATFTTVLSSMIMNRPNETAASVSHLRFSSAKIRERIRRLP